MLESFAKKKIEIIVETTMIPRLISLARKEAISGYTILPVVEGVGRSGAFGEGSLSRSFSAQHFMVVADAAIAERFMSAAADLLASYRAIILISDVRVLRDDHF